jgi:hypothetical protein
MPHDGESGPHAQAWAAQWEEAASIVADLEARGFICGHPSTEDAEAVVRALMRSGHIGGSEPPHGERTPDDPT